MLELRAKSPPDMALHGSRRCGDAPVLAAGRGPHADLVLSRAAWANLSPEKSLSQHFWAMIGQYAGASWSLTIICLAIFYLTGFYTYGRFYQGRYKALIVLQAVCQSYLIYGFVSYAFFGVAKTLPLRHLLSLGRCRRGVADWRSAVAAYLEAHCRSRTRSARSGKGDQTKRVLVIGGAGYIGSALLPKLLASGYRVRLLDLLMYDTGPIDGVMGHPNLEVSKAIFATWARLSRSCRASTRSCTWGRSSAIPRAN